MKYKAKYSQLVMPDDANNVGTLFGGQMISWICLLYTSDAADE